MSHTQLRIKCMSCGLHFIVLTWFPDQHGRSVFCPECGTRGSQIRWTIIDPGNIFEWVPGAAGDLRITPEVGEEEDGA